MYPAIFLALAIGQPWPSLSDVYDTGEPYVLFVGTKARAVKGVATAHEREYVKTNGSVVRWGVFVVRANGYGDWLPVDASDSDIRQAAVVERQVQAISPVPFVLPTALPEARPVSPVGDGSPWLPKERQDSIRKAWPKSVPFPSGLRFYELPRRYQSLYTMNGGRSKFNDPTPLHDMSAEFRVSGGMEGIDESTWQSFKGLALNGKSIEVWQEDADVRAFSLVPRWRWRFPVGTVAVDALFHQATAFTIRTATRTETGWTTKVIHNDAAAAPAKYHGLNRSCASCHDLPAQIVEVPGRIYLHSVWGDDGRYSWRPFREDGTLDRRWPITEKQ